MTATLATLTAVGCAAALAGLILHAWTRPALPAARRLTGPVIVTVLVGLYTLAVAPFTRSGQTWPLLPVLAGLVLVVILHVGLVIRGPGRAVLLAYADAHLAFWAYFAMVCLLRISKDSL